MARKLFHFLHETEPEKLLRATERERDRVLLLAALYCGLRVSELTGLRVEHVDFTRRTIFVHEGKGKKDRVVPCPRKLVGPLRGWIGPRQGGLVWPSPRGGRLSSRAVQLLFKRLAARAGLPDARKPRRCTPHKMRHAYATRLLDTGASIYEVKELLGHSSIAVTENYLHATAHKLAAAADRI